MHPSPGVHSARTACSARRPSVPIAARLAVFASLVLAGIALAPIEAYARGEAGHDPVEIDIPLAIDALSPSGHAGFARTDACVTVGIPLPDAAGIVEVSELALAGRDVWQMRPLAHWESGHVKWVLVDFPTDVSVAGEVPPVRLVRRESDAPAHEPIGSERGDRIDIRTGALRVNLARTGTSLVRRIRAGGRVWAAGDDAFVVRARGEDGREYLGTILDSRPAYLEENGPLRAVVRADGVHRDLDGVTLCDFTLRLTFTLGSSVVRGEYRVRNASSERARHIRHRGISIDLSTTLENDLGFAFARPEAPWSVTGDLHSGDVAMSVVAYNDSLQQGGREVRWHEGCEGWVPPVAYDPSTESYTQEGTIVLVNGVPVVESPRARYSRVAWADLTESSGAGVSAGVLHAAQLWPVSMTMTGEGQLELGLFAPQTGRPWTVDFGSHETREFVLGFHAGNHDAYRDVFEAQYPVVARPSDPEDINRAGVLADKLVSVEEQNAQYARLGIDLAVEPMDVPSYRVRFFATTQGGGNNQHDHAHHDFVHFLRTGESWAWLQAVAWADYRSDQAVPHSDDFVFATDGSYPVVEPENEGEYLVARGHRFDGAHRHSRHLPLLYYFTGRERYKDAFLDEIEAVAFDLRVFVGYLNTRVQSKLMHVGMLGARFLQEIAGIDERVSELPYEPAEVRGAIERYMTTVLDARYDFDRVCEGTQPKGWADAPGRDDRDPRRFFFAGGDRERNEEPKFHLFSIFPTAMWNYAFHAVSDDPNVPVVRRRVLDLEHYFWSYLYSSCPEDPSRRTIGESQVRLFEGCEAPPAPDACGFEGDNFHPAYQLYSFAWDVTGDPLYLDRGIAFMRGQHAFGGDLAGLNARRSEHLDFLWRLENARTDDIAPRLFDRNVEPDGNGSWQVRFRTDEPARGKLAWVDANGERDDETETELDEAHALAIKSFRPAELYGYVIAARDGEGNRSVSDAHAFVADDFSIDSLSAYERSELRGGTVRHDAQARAIRFEGATDSHVRLGFSWSSAIGGPRQLPLEPGRGSMRVSAALGAAHADDARVRLICAGADGDRYRVVIERDDAEGARRRMTLERVSSGVVEELATLSTEAFEPGQMEALAIRFRPAGFEVSVESTGETLAAATGDDPPVLISRVSFEALHRDALLDRWIVELR